MNTEREVMYTRADKYILPHGLKHYICFACDRVCIMDKRLAQHYAEDGVVALGDFFESVIWPGHKRPVCVRCHKSKEG
jgi:hypothetical protein